MNGAYTGQRSRRVVLVASKTGYQTRAFDEAAQHIGIELVMATDRCHVLDDPWGDRALPLQFENPEAAAGVIAAVQPAPAGIIAVGDRPASIAALAAQRLGIPFSAPGAVAICRNKNEARRRFEAAGLPVPTYFTVPADMDPCAALERAPWPCVLKPLGLSASRGVIRADSPAEFVAAFRRIVSLLCSPDIARLGEHQDRFIQIESFIPGREFAVEAMLTKGRLQVHAIFDKPDDLSGPFFEETIYVTPSREPEQIQRAIIDATRKAVTALGLTHGPIHAEMRVNERGVWMLEVAARPIGGLCAQALRFTGGVTLEELILFHALGEDVSQLRLQPGATGVMMIPVPRNGIYVGATGIDTALSVPSVTGIVVTAKEGQPLMKLPEGASYTGFIFARADTPQAVEAALLRAHAQLQFDIRTELPVLRTALSVEFS
ncbi:MAG TPA: ATP-grasp domain-containing protein [Bryobacteraceae bacterium]|nr:ATP-grasp domain-containing protein [Bryobacteraceae bacterium]